MHGRWLQQHPRNNRSDPLCLLSRSEQVAIFKAAHRPQPSELPPLYQIHNWSIRTTTSLPSSELVPQNHHLFTKFRIGPSEPPIIYQIQNWSLKTAVYLPNSELVPQNHHLFTKFTTGPSELPSGLPNSELSLCQVSSLTSKHLLQACLLPNNLRDQSWPAVLMPFNSL